MDRSISITTVRVGDLHPGDVFRFDHPIDRGGKPRKTFWFAVTDLKHTEAGKVVVSMTQSVHSTQHVFHSPYELVELQQKGAEEFGTPGTADGPPKGDPNYIVEGHWRQDEAGQMHWVEPHLYNPEQGAEDLLEYMAGSDDTDDEPYCDYCEKTGHYFRSCPARDDAPEPEEDGS